MTRYCQSFAFRSVRSFHLEAKSSLVSRSDVRFRRPRFVSSSLGNGGSLVSFRGRQTRTDPNERMRTGQRVCALRSLCKRTPNRSLDYDQSWSFDGKRKAFAANRVPGEELTLYYYTVIVTMLSSSMLEGTKPLFLFINQLTKMI